MKIFLALLFLSLPTYAQYLHRSNPGTPGATAQTVTTAGSGNCPGTGCVTVNTEGTDTLIATITGTYVGTLSVVCSNDLLATVLTLPTTFLANQTGTFVIPNPGCRIMGIYAAAWTSGTASARLDSDPSPSNIVVPALTGAFAVTGTLTTITTDTVSINLSGAQWATVQFKVTTAGTSKQNAQISIDGGTNWILAPYAKRLSTASANPTMTDFSISGGVTLVANDLWEIPLPGNATNFRLVCGTSGTATSATLMGGTPYTPGIQVVATFYDQTESGIGAGLAAVTADVSGWQTATVYLNSPTGQAAIVRPVDDTGATIASQSVAGTAASASTAVLSRAAYGIGAAGSVVLTGGQIGSFPLLTRRIQWSLASTGTVSTGRIRVELSR